jgi:hypothetical protein
VLNNKQVIDAYLGGDLDIIHRSGGPAADDRPAAQSESGTSTNGARRRNGQLVAPGREERP